jgi:hypothetical protein
VHSLGPATTLNDRPKSASTEVSRVDSLCYTLLDTDGLAVLDNCPDVIDSIPKLMRDDKNIEDAAKEGNELFLDVCESFRYRVMSYGSEQTVPREVEMQQQIMSIKDNTLKYQRYLELTAKRTNSIVFTISRRRW